MRYNTPPHWLVKMPKTDLHCHLGGSLRPHTILELADRFGVQLPTDDEQALRAIISCKGKPKNLACYLDGFALCESVLRSGDAFSRVAYEVCEDAHKEGVKVFELRFGPTNYEKNGLKLHEIVEGTLDGLRRAREDYDMYTGLIICGIRTDAEAVKKAAELAVNYQDEGVIGFDLAGKEAGHRPKDLKPLIEPVIHNFLPITIHAGEDDTVASIAEAIQDLGAWRIGHAVSMRESPRLLAYANKRRLGLEVCLTSNVDTGSVASVQTHPVRAYYLGDLRVTINTDNRTVSGTNVTNECLILLNELGFNKEDIFHVARHGIKAAFLDSRTMKRLLDDFDAYVKSDDAQRE